LPASCVVQNAILCAEDLFFASGSDAHAFRAEHRAATSDGSGLGRGDGDVVLRPAAGDVETVAWALLDARASNAPKAIRAAAANALDQVGRVVVKG
jgi:hypothetical protein